MGWHATVRVFALCSATAFVSTLLLWITAVDSNAQTSFDHFTTGFRLEGAHRFAECEACHSDGIFAGTPTQCADCHTQASRTRATSKPATHLQVSDECESCHRPNAWAPVIRFDHLEVLGTCSTCHNNLTARGQHPQHISTMAECDSCHNTRFWQ